MAQTFGMTAEYGQLEGKNRKGDIDYFEHGNCEEKAPQQFIKQKT
jgi:hypothetical protein